MTQSAYEILTDILRDNDAEIHRTAPGGYADGLAATGARIRARMAGLPRSSVVGQGGAGHYGGGGGGGDPGPDAPPANPRPPSGRVIDADFTSAQPGSLQEAMGWTDRQMGSPFGPVTQQRLDDMASKRP